MRVRQRPSTLGEYALNRSAANHVGCWLRKAQAPAAMIQIVPPTDPSWTRHVVYRTKRATLTWRFRLALLTVTLAAFWLTSNWWSPAIARSLVCDEGRAPADAALVENFDPEYLLFERAKQLRQTGAVSHVLVPVPLDGDAPNAVTMAITRAMADLSRLGAFDVIPVRLVEPISLNAANDVRGFLVERSLRSVTVIAPLFRSRRSALVYRAALEPVGIRVQCQPVAGTRDATTWTRTWHGVQGVAEQWLKLQYYRLYVMPFLSTKT